MVAKTTRKNKTKKRLKKELLDSLKEINDLEERGLDTTADAITDPLETVRIIHCSEEIIKTQNKSVIGYVGKQGQLLKKFRKTEQFLENVGKASPQFILRLDCINP